MTNIIKLFLINLIFTTSLFSCSLCSADVPSVNVIAKITNNNNESLRVDIQWDFHKEFLKNLSMYDTNKNNIFDKTEKLLIEDALVSYLKDTNYLTDIIYLKRIEGFNLDKREKIVPKKTNLNFDNGTMQYKYSFDLDIKFAKDHKLYIGFYDMGGNFNFTLNDLIVNDYNDYKRIEPDVFYSYIYFYEKYEPIKEEKKIKLSPNTLIKIAEPKNLDNNIENKTIKEKEQYTSNNSFYTTLENNLQEIKKSLEDLLEDIKENNSIISYFWLLLFSFAYGVIHALGPGHGKSLISAYFLNQDRSYIKAFNMSALIGVVHTFSAFILTVIVYYAVGMMFSSITTDVEKMATKVSALIIIAIALYMIYKKIPKKKSPTDIKFTTTSGPSFVQTNKPIKQHTLSCSCSACKTDSNDIGVVLAAGIIPCPGTVTIFIFTMSLGIYFVGFLSAIFMSLGMSLVIFVTALLSIKVKQSANRNETLVKILDYGSLAFILFLGVILFIAT